MDEHPVLFALLTVLLLGVVGAHATRWALLPRTLCPVPRARLGSV